MTVLHALTGANLSIPYKIDEKGIVSIVRYDSENKASILHSNGDKEEKIPLSFLLKVDPSLGKTKNKQS